MTLIDNKITLLENGIDNTPLMESVDIETYWKYAPILEAVDQIASPEVISEAKQGKTGKLKAAIDKAVKYFYGLDPTNAGRFLPSLIKLLTIQVTAGVGGHVVGGALAASGAGLGGVLAGGLVVGVAVAAIFTAIDNFITSKANSKNVGATISAVESAIAKLKEKQESTEDARAKQAISTEIGKLSTALSRLQKIQKGQDSKAKTDGKAINESVEGTPTYEGGKTESTNDSSANVAAVGTTETVASTTVVNDEDHIGSVFDGTNAQAKVENMQEAITAEVDLAYAGLQESISNYVIASSQAEIGIIQEGAVSDWFVGVKKSINAYMETSKKQNEIKRNARTKRKQTIAKNAVVVKAVKSIPVPEGFKCKIHEGSNDKIRMNLPTSDVEFHKYWKSYILSLAKKGEKALRNQFDEMPVKERVEMELGSALKVFIKTTKDTCTRSEFEALLRQYHLGKVVTSTNPNIPNMINNVVNAPKYLEHLEVKYFSRVNDITKSLLADLEKIAESEPSRSGLQALAAYIKQTSEAEMRAYEICYEIICTIADECYTVLSRLSGATIQEAVALLESIEGTPTYEGGKAESTNDSSANVAAIGASGDVASSSVVLDEDHIGSVFDNNSAQSKVENMQEAATDQVLFESVMLLMENKMNMIEHGIASTPLLESVDMETYWKFAPILEAVDAIASPEVLAEAKAGKMGKLKAAIDKAVKYFYGLDEANAGRFLPSLIKFLVLITTSTIGGYVAGGAVGRAAYTAAGGGLTGLAVGVSAAYLTGAAIGTVAGAIYNAIEKFMTTKANAKNVGATITALENAITTLNSKVESVDEPKLKAKVKSEIDRLQSALTKLKAIQKQESDKADKKTVNESAVADVLFESVMTLMANNITMMKNGIPTKPLLESVDMETYWEFAPILEAVDAIASPEVIAEAKAGKTGRLKAAVDKAVKYFYGLDEKNAGRFLPELIKLLVLVIVASAGGYIAGGAVGTAAYKLAGGGVTGLAVGVGAAYVAGSGIGALAGIIYNAIEKFMTTKANAKNVGATITALENAIETLTKKSESIEDRKAREKMITDINRLQEALRKLKAIEKQEAKKAMTESVEGTPTYEGGKAESTNDSSANVAAVGATGGVASTSVVNDEEHIGSLYDDNDAEAKAKALQESVVDYWTF
jgi:hypothetical protein